MSNQNNFIVYGMENGKIVHVETKASRLAAVRAYNKLGKTNRNLIEHGWVIAENAEPKVRIAAGFTPFPN